MTPQDLIDAAQDYRRQAKKPGRLADRARLIILAEEMEMLGDALALEFGGTLVQIKIGMRLLPHAKLFN